MENKYAASVRILHWIMAALFALIFVLGAVMAAFKQTEPWTLYSLHKSCGVLVFLLVWLRLAARLRRPAPPPPPEIPARLYRLAGVAVVLLYAGMLLVPISGYALSNVHGFAVKFFGLPLPDLFPKSPEWESFVAAAHFYLAYGFLGVIGLHVGAVVFHHVRGEEILRRIT